MSVNIYADKRTAHTFNYILNGRWHTGDTTDIPGQLNIEYLMVQLTGMNRYSTMLDFGCGQGLVTYDYHVLSRGATVYGVTNNIHQLAEAKRLVKSLTNKVHYRLIGEDGILPFPDATFDIIACTESLCHLNVAQRKDIFQEFRRVLKPKGQIILEDWFHARPDGSNAKEINQAYGTYLSTHNCYADELYLAGFRIYNAEPICVQWDTNIVSTLCRTAWYRFMYPRLILSNPFKVNMNLVSRPLIETGLLLQHTDFYIAIIHAVRDEDVGSGEHRMGE